MLVEFDVKRQMGWTLSLDEVLLRNMDSYIRQKRWFKVTIL